MTRSTLTSPHSLARPQARFVREGAVLTLALALCACGPADPRFGSVSVSAAAPRASLTGHTSATGVPAIDLSPGCPGFVDASVPEHVVRLDDASAITISARSLRGPLSIAVVGPGEVRCDSDEGTGHAPHVTVTQPGEYLVHVGSLTAPADLAYELTLAPASTDATGTPSGGDHRVSVTVTSDPSGATVRTPEGETLGTTPAMFVLTVPESQLGTDRRFVLEMPGHPSTEVLGHVLGDTMVIHAALTESATVAAPTVGATTTAPATLASGALDASSTAAAVPIRDYRTSTLTQSVPTACTIASMSVDVDAQHAYSQDLRITLHGPGGASATLANHTGGSRPYSSHTYAFDDARGALHVFAGTSSQGTWSIDVRDDAGEDEGTLRAFTLHFTCGDPSVAAAPPPPPVTSAPSRPIPRLPRPTPPGVLDPWAPRPPAPPVPPPAPPATGVFRNGQGAGRVLQPTW